LKWEAPHLSLGVNLVPALLTENAILPIVILNFPLISPVQYLQVGIPNRMTIDLQKATRITSTATMSTRITCLLEDGNGWS